MGGWKGFLGYRIAPELESPLDAFPSESARLLPGSTPAGPAGGE